MVFLVFLGTSKTVGIAFTRQGSQRAVHRVRAIIVAAESQESFCCHKRDFHFVPILFPLFGIKRVEEGLTGLYRSRNRWGFKADRVLVYAIAGLSRRRRGFETPWDYQ